MIHKESINKFLQAVKQAIKDEQKRKRITASGESARSLKVDVDGNSGELTGRAYFEQQIYGRGPTQAGGRGALRKRIREWLDTKRWSAGLPEKRKEGLSWAISKKIHERGTLRGRDSRFPGLAFGEIVEKERAFLRVDVSGNQQEVFSEIFKGLKQVG